MEKNAIAPPLELAFIELEQALRQPQCAICRIIRQSEERYIWGLLYEFTGDPLIRGELNKTLGFCHYHAHLTTRVVRELQLVSGSGVARIYETVVQCYRHRLLGVEVGRRGGLLRRVKKPREGLVPEHCIVCSFSQSMEMVELGALGRFLRHPSHQDLYQHSDGLCNPHFAQLLAKADWGVKNFLLADQKRRMERLEQNLWELQRKQSYDVHEAVTEDEAGSWMEAIWRFTGTSWSRLLTRE